LVKPFLTISVFAVAFQCLASTATLYEQLVIAAQAHTQQSVSYDGSYRTIGYPMGDVPEHLGVCTDLVVRAYRGIGLDLQKLVHQDMQANFSIYPNLWNLNHPDTNIDHRRVPNLQVFFKRKGEVLSISRDVGDYRAGNLVTWMLPRNMPHIGIVSNEYVKGTRRPKIIHNIGNGPVEDDILFNYKITGHYRYAG